MYSLPTTRCVSRLGGLSARLVAVVCALGLASPDRAIGAEKESGAAAGVDKKVDKYVCIKAHELAQVLQKEPHRRSEAIEQLTICSSSECPAPVRQDCLNWALEQQGPSHSPDPPADQATEAGRSDARTVSKADPSSDPLAGRKDLRTNIRIIPDEEESVDSPLLSMEPVRPKPPSQITPWLTAGVSAVALGLGAYWGLTGLVRADHLKKTCAPNCSSEDVGGLRARFLEADLALLGGAVCGGVATFMFWNAAGGRSRSSLEGIGASIGETSMAVRYSAAF